METVVALVLLSGCILLISVLIQRTSSYQKRSEALLDASALADKVMGDIRIWAGDPAHYDSDWSAWNGQVLSDADFPELQARVDVNRGVRVLSPDFSSENPLSDPRVLPQGCVEVRITAGKDLNSPVGRVSVWSMVASPSPNATTASIQVTAADTSPMAVGGSRQYDAQAFDNGRPLPECTFEWRIHRVGNADADGNATSRDGRHFNVRHTASRWNSTLLINEPASGDVSLEAEARISGVLVRGSATVTLLPPAPTP